MQARRKTLEVLARQEQSLNMMRTAAGFPPQEKGQPFGGDQGGGAPFGDGPGLTNHKREIPEKFSFDPKALKPLAKMLWSMSVSLGHALTAHRQFTKLKSATISPDGMVGGRGYVMSVKDVRKMLYDACEALSAISDTVHDEINAPHWKPKLAELEKADADSIENLVQDAERMLDNPEEDAEEDVEEAVETGHAPWHHPAVQKDNKKKKKDPSSQMPDGGDAETLPTPKGQTSPDHPEAKRTMKHASTDTLRDRILARHLGKTATEEPVTANSSLPVDTLPGPRVQHLDRGDVDQVGPYGSVNRDEVNTEPDDWERDEGVGNDYNYPSGWENDLSEKQASAVRPESLRKLKEIAHRKGDANLIDLADAIEHGNWKVVDMLFSLLRAKRNLHDVPDDIAGLLTLRHNRTATWDQPAGWDNDHSEREAAPLPAGGVNYNYTRGPLLDHMVKDLQHRKRLEVSDGKKDFFVIMKEPKSDKFDPNPKPWYAPSLDGHKPAAQWVVMDESKLRNWLQMLRPRLHSVNATEMALGYGFFPPGANLEVEFPAFMSNLFAALEPVGTSAIPDANSEPTPGQAFDFGIGDGNGNDAHGQAAGGYGEGNPGAPDSNPGGGTGNMGVYGPQSGLPKDPGGNVNPEESDSTPTIENEIGGRGHAHTASIANFWLEGSVFTFEKTAALGSAELPNDEEPPVARSDYFDGPKGDNMQDSASPSVGATKLPNEGIPAKLTPNSARPSHNQEHMFAQSDLPGDGGAGMSEFDRDLGPDATNTVREPDVPYITWDDNTHEMRPEMNTHQDPVQGPFVHNDLSERPSNG